MSILCECGHHKYSHSWRPAHWPDSTITRYISNCDICACQKFNYARADELHTAGADPALHSFSIGRQAAVDPANWDCRLTVEEAADTIVEHFTAIARSHLDDGTLVRRSSRDLPVHLL